MVVGGEEVPDFIPHPDNEDLNNLMPAAAITGVPVAVLLTPATARVPLACAKTKKEVWHNDT